MRLRKTVFLPRNSHAFPSARPLVCGGLGLSQPATLVTHNAPPVSNSSSHPWCPEYKLVCQRYFCSVFSFRSSFINGSKILCLHAPTTVTKLHTTCYSFSLLQGEWWEFSDILIKPSLRQELNCRVSPSCAPTVPLLLKFWPSTDSFSSPKDRWFSFHSLHSCQLRLLSHRAE